MSDLTLRQRSTDSNGLETTAFDKSIKDIGNSLHAEVVAVLGSGYGASVSVTRPANTDTYGAGDVVGATAAAWAFPLMGPSGGRIMITSASLEIDVSAVPAGMTSFRLHLYSVTPPSALADAATWDLPSGDRASYLGYIDLGSPADVGSTLFVQSDQNNKQLKLAGTGLWGYLVTNGSYQASSAAVKVINLHSVAL
jgi:hypothetical protein